MPRLACFERIAFIDAAMRFGAIHTVHGGCMTRTRELERLACFDGQVARAPAVAPAAAAPTALPLPTVAVRPPGPPRPAQAPTPGATRRASPPTQTPSPAPPVRRLPQASAPASAADAGMLAVLGRDGALSGLYLRGQAGYAFGLDAGIKDSPPSGVLIACLARGTGCGGKLDDIGGSPSFGAGVGYRWNRQLRFDVTADYRPGFAVDDKDQATPFPASYKGDISSLVGLVNVYWDMPIELGASGSWLGRIHPWIGVGIGVARNKTDDLSYSQRLASGATATGKLLGDAATSFAWQVGLGAGVDLTPQFVLDLGYRYLDGGDIKTKAGTIVDSVAGRLPVGAAKGDIKSHELQIGLRYKL